MAGPVVDPGKHPVFGIAHAQVKSLRQGGLSMADTLGSPLTSDNETTTYIPAGWIAHGEAAQSHHYLCRYRLASHALDVSAHTGDPPADRRCRHRGGRSRCGDCPPACAQPAGWS